MNLKKQHTLHKSPMAMRFRGFLPVVVDVETGGFNPKTDALLEIAISLIKLDDNGVVHCDPPIGFHIEPFHGANIDEKALEFNKIKPFHPFRFAVAEKEALNSLFKTIRQEMKQVRCHRAVLIGHNPGFDLSFLQAAVKRTGINNNPFHPFTTFDTATLSALAFGQTVLARALKVAGIEFNEKEAHSALYDTGRTAELFCKIVNSWREKGGWPLEDDDFSDDDVSSS